MTLYEQHTAERQADKEQGFVRHLWWEGHRFCHTSSKHKKDSV
jgi:hypothetical protein